ncbi:FecR family protein [Pseudothauera rhizosphaerae]|uniref:FecR family protein n=1 Tax=Pseudothauera rhizosphaerae TaxID=2565932 RepID=UPI001454CF19|nr:FecR domain-containing protein [Pseudothauera rhizosphaerae]
MKPLVRFVSILSLLLLAAAAARAAEWSYVVRPGDTLIGIAENYLSQPARWGRLQALNEVADPFRLMPGTRLRIPVAWLRRDAAVATVIHVRGSVRRVSPEGEAPVRVGDRLGSGETLASAEDSNASLRFVDGSRLLVSEGSRITLGRMVEYGGTGMAETTIRLHGGQIDSRVQPQHRPAARYRIESEALNLGVRGTDFRVAVGADGAARGEVSSGRVLATGGRRTVGLDAGYGTVARAGEAPAAPIALAPAPALDGLPRRVELLPLRFAWPAGEGNTGWRVRIFPEDDGDALLADEVSSTPSVQYGDLPDGRYRLLVRAVAGNGLEGLDGEHRFEIAARPEPPLMTAPAAGAVLRGGEATLRWARPLGIGAFRLQVADDPAFSPPLRVDLAIDADTRHTVHLPAGDFHWRIASVMPDGRAGPFGLPQPFSVRPLPEGPDVGAPEEDGEGVLLRWHAGEPDLSFRVQVARDAAFGEPLADERVAEPQFRLPRGGGGTYFVRVQAIDGNGNAGPFGRPQQIDFPAPGPWPLLLVVLLIAL